MSKIRQALEYERKLTDLQVAGHVGLTDTQLKTEKKLRKQQVHYERLYTDGQFSQLNIVAEEHRLFHEREHLLYESAIEKAASSLSASFQILQSDIDHIREESHRFLTTERFEREHEALTDKTTTAVANLGEKIAGEEKVTIKQATKDEVIESIRAQQRWMIGILITVGIFGATTLLHVFKVI